MTCALSNGSAENVTAGNDQPEIDAPDDRTRSALTDNQILTGLPTAERALFIADCEAVDLKLSQVIYRPGQRIAFVYFPITGCITQISSIEGRNSLEVGMVGSEGMVGLPRVLGMNLSPLLNLVQGSGTSLRMAADRFDQHLQQSAALRQRLLRYVNVVLIQLVQAATCVRFHQAEARLARLMLMTQDRAHADEFQMTHVFLANMLGIRRVGVTQAASALQLKKLINYHRGKIKILDRTGLSVEACACYQADRDTYAAGFQA